MALAVGQVTMGVALLTMTLTVLALTYWAADAMINRYLKNPGKLV